MGWYSSIHIAQVHIDAVFSLLERIGEHRCFIGVSGESWIGVYSERCELSLGEAGASLVKQISHDAGFLTIGLYSDEDSFSYCLFKAGKRIDEHPVNFISRFSLKQREILNLATSVSKRRQLDSILSDRKSRSPHERVGMRNEDEFIAKAKLDLANVHKMSREELEAMAQKYSRARSGQGGVKLNSLCEAIGIREHHWNYSDLRELFDRGELKQMCLKHLD